MGSSPSSLVRPVVLVFVRLSVVVLLVVADEDADGIFNYSFLERSLRCLESKK